MCDEDIPIGEQFCDKCYTQLVEENEEIDRELERWEEKEEERLQTWSEYIIHESSDGSCRVDCATNDNNDDGYPDYEIVTWTMNFKSLEDAIKVTGRSRTGCIGTKVTVLHNGVKI